MPCHAMLCYAMPCYAMPCHAIPCYAMPCYAMPCHPKRRDVHGRLLSPKYSHWHRCSACRERWKEIGHACGQCKIRYRNSDKNGLRWPFLANCTTFAVLAELSSLWLFLIFLFSCFLVFLFSCFLVFLFSCLEISKAASEDSNSDLQMNFFRESEKSRRNQRWHFRSRFSGVDQLSGPMHYTISANRKHVKWNKQWYIELFLIALRSGDIHLIVGYPISFFFWDNQHHGNEWVFALTAFER
jgi:hypothetical protein